MGLERRQYSPRLSYLSLAGALALALVSFSCGGGSSLSGSTQKIVLQGQVTGGQQAVSGAEIRLYAAGSDVGDAGYGATASSLLVNGSDDFVSTDGGGRFNITGLYTCANDADQVYIVATGGNPGLAPGTDNLALAMMAALGNCGDLRDNHPFVSINEVTTVASVYALAQFMAVNPAAPGALMGTSTTNQQGLLNAFATVRNLVNTSTGKIPGPSLPTGATVPRAEINTLADMLAICVSSDGSSGPTDPCGMLFSAATGRDAVAPQNTIDAALDIALSPGFQVAERYALVTGTPPFLPRLNSQPTDWTMGVNYIGGGMNSPYGIALDSLGEVWVANNAASSISKFANNGTALSPDPDAFGSDGNGGLSGTYYLAIVGGTNRVWISNFVDSTVSLFASDGTAISSPDAYGNGQVPPNGLGGLNEPLGVAVDGSGNVWVANQGCDCISEIDQTGAAISPAGGFTGGGLSSPSAVAFDALGNVWVTNAGADQLSVLLASDGSPVTSGSGYSGGGLSNPRWMAVDHSNNVWVANFSGTNVISEFDSTGTPVGSGFSGGGLDHPYTIAVDGRGNVWASNQGTGVIPGTSVSEFDNTGTPLSPSSGYTGGTPNAPVGIAIDRSGNVWISNQGSNNLIELVGAAGPVLNPLSLQASTNQLGVRP